MTARISAIIPVRNGELYLGEAIESVLRQTYAPFEVIVVDNGSADGSRVVAERFGKPVRVVDECLPGTARARNAGVRAASGDFIAFLDADDLWEPPKLARQIEILTTQSDVDLVFTNLREFISPELTEAQRANLCARPDCEGWNSSTMLSRASSLRSVGPMPELHVGEFIAWFGVAQTAGLRSRMLSDVLVRRRVHLANMTRQPHSMDGYLKAAKMVLDSRRARNRPQGA